MNRNILIGLAIALSACAKEKAPPSVIQTEPVSRRTIVVAAEATGTVEPVNIVEVKSKASGQITRMTVETGSEVKRGDLLVQLDTRDVDQQWKQTKADQELAQARLDLALANRSRQRSLFEQRVITEAEFQQGFSDSSSAHAALVRADAALDLAEQRRDDATVRAPIEGTVIEKTVSEGSVITSSTGSMGAGTTLLKMADLSTVRVRAHFNETDIANVVDGLAATVTVDAFPGQPFRGVVEKIEPTAVVQQSVTLFPVLISLDNRERKLKPGMNGEVRVEIDQRDNVLAVASDAIRTTREAEFVAGLLGLPPDSVRKQVDAQIASLGTGGGSTVVGQTSRGDVDITAAAFQDPQQQPQQGRRGGGQGPGGPAPTAAECKPIADAYAKNPRVKARLDSLGASMRSPDADRQAIMASMTAAYGTLGVDAMLARRCGRVLNPQAGGQRTEGGQRGAGTTAGRTAQQTQGGNPGATGGNTGGGQGRGRFGNGFGARGGGRGAGGDARTGLVFVKKGATYEPRVIRTGLASYDYTEVTAGLEEGEEVVLITSAQLQQQQQQQRDNVRARQGGPLGQPAGGGAGGRGPGGGGGGGGPGGGRGPGGD